LPLAFEHISDVDSCTPIADYSGKMMLRVAPKSIAEQLLLLSGKSLNQSAEEVLEEAADHFAEARLSAR
jgi:predicted HicB family RNase H-like nuclease